MVAQNLKFYRDKKGFSQAQVAEKLAIDQSQYCKLESGQLKLSADMLEKIATILDVDIKDLYAQAPVTNIQNQHNQQNMTGQHFNVNVSPMETIAKSFEIIATKQDAIINLLLEQSKQNTTIIKYLLDSKHGS
jgi:transcriptional regulator with XRE-family HTH domain